MRKITLLVASVAVLFSVEGCDFFRTLAGRPTSKDIELKREAIAEEARARALADSVRMSVKEETAEVEDTLDVREAISSNGIKLSGSALVSQVGREGITGRYVVIIGAFGSSANAEALASRAREASYETVLIPYTNGLVAVGLCPSDNLSEAYASLLKVREEAFSPSDAWIMDKTEER